MGHQRKPRRQRAMLPRPRPPGHKPGQAGTQAGPRPGHRWINRPETRRDTMGSQKGGRSTRHASGTGPGFLREGPQFRANVTHDTSTERDSFVGHLGARRFVLVALPTLFGYAMRPRPRLGVPGNGCVLSESEQTRHTVSDGAPRFSDTRGVTPVAL